MKKGDSIYSSDKYKRIIVVQIPINQDMHNMNIFFSNLCNAFDDSIKIIGMPVDKIIGNKQIYDITGARNDVVERIEKKYAEYVDFIKNKKNNLGVC